MKIKCKFFQNQKSIRKWKKSKLPNKKARTLILKEKEKLKEKSINSYFIFPLQVLYSQKETKILNQQQTILIPKEFCLIRKKLFMKNVN